MSGFSLIDELRGDLDKMKDLVAQLARKHQVGIADLLASIAAGLSHEARDHEERAGGLDDFVSIYYDVCADYLLWVASESQKPNGELFKRIRALYKLRKKEQEPPTQEGKD